MVKTASEFIQSKKGRFFLDKTTEDELDKLYVSREKVEREEVEKVIDEIIENRFDADKLKQKLREIQ